MNENETNTVGNTLNADQASEIGGGDLCTPGEYLQITQNLKESYDNLVDFTSYVIERVLGK